MESFVFNSFKTRLMNGEVELSGSFWKHYPVNKKFVENYEDDIRSLSSTSAFIMYDLAKNKASIIYDSAKNSGYYGKTGKNDISLFHDWYNYYGTKINMVEYVYKPMGDTDVAMKPEFVTKAGWNSFSDKDRCPYLKELFFPDNPNPTDNDFYHDTGYIDEYGDPIPRGFYYVTTKEHLLWCAEKVNNTSYDNEINIVLGDNIGYDDISIIKTPIGVNPAHPFNGIFFGNGFGFVNIELQCNNDVNGIIGYLGKDGIIDHVWIKNCHIVCNKPLSISHLSTGSFDIAAGFICGKNDGTIRNVYVTDKIGFKNFVPRMYSVANKSDNEPEVNALSNPAANFFYPDYMCYNSLGNIVPYIGYFNEGVFATYSGYSKVDNKFYTYWNTEDCNNGYMIKEPGGDNINSPHEWYYWNGLYYEDSETVGAAGYLFSYTAPANRKNILWYDANIVESTFRLVNPNGANSIGIGRDKDPGLIPWITDSYSQNSKEIEYARYFNRSMKMNQQNRAAYYVAPVVGVNCNKLQDVYVDSVITFSGSFVGFAGGIAGKQAKGTISNCKVNITAQDEILSGAPVRDNLTTHDNSDNTKNYSFEKKSIKNIGGLFGSLVVGDGNSLNIASVNSFFDNKMNIVRNKNDEDIYQDYYFDNRFGGLAAIVEYNSCNISDIWFFNSKIAEKYEDKSKYGPGINFNAFDRDVNDQNGLLRSIKVTNSSIRYIETKDDRITDLKPYTIRELNNTNYQYGVSSPLFGEIKPIYLSVPSIISSPFHNTTKDIPDRVDGSHERIGLITMDQQLAAPKSDYPYWSINLEVDLPGISNGLGLWQNDGTNHFIGWKADGYAGGVIDCLNTTSAANFDLDVRSIAKTLVKWENSDIYSQDSTNCFETVTIPSATIIGESTINLCVERVDDYDVVTGEKKYSEDIVERHRADNIGTGTGDVQGIDLPASLATLNPPAGSEGYNFRLFEAPGLGKFQANKKFMQYPYFGSDIVIEPTPLTEDNKDRDTFDLTKLDFDYVEIIYSQAPYYGERGGGDGDAILGVYNVKIQIAKDAFSKAPFTKVETNIEEIDRNYKVYVKAIEDGSYKHDDGDILTTDYCGTRIWRRSDSHKGTKANGISYIPDYYDSDEASKINDWLMSNAFGARYGWFFYSDDDDGKKDREYLSAVILFDFNVYDDTRFSDGIAPPNFPFCLAYLAGQKRTGSSYDDGTMDWYGSSNRSAKALIFCDSVKFYKDDAEISISADEFNTIRAKRFTELNTRGYFHNGLVKSNGGTVDGVTQYGNPLQINIDAKDWYGSLSGNKYFESIASKAIVDNGNEYSTYFKYTYTKKLDLINSISGIGNYGWYAKYDYMNGKAGFWVQNEKASFDEFNDKFHYTQNYMTFGKTLNEQCILSYLNANKENRQNGCHVSGFSADDFEGIYVTDYDNNPVMYIDVGMGECSEGTSWSYECYSGSHTNNEDDVYGLLLEVNTDEEVAKETEEDV